MTDSIQAGEPPLLVGRTFGPSPWLKIDQERIDRFADATDDHQYIHVDPERAAATPFGRTIAHGFLTLSLIPRLTSSSGPVIEGLVMGINYGSDKVRFLQPVRSGSRIRASQECLEAVQKTSGQWLVKYRITVEIEDEAKPALVAETLVLYVVRT